MRDLMRDVSQLIWKIGFRLQKARIRALRMSFVMLWCVLYSYICWSSVDSDPEIIQLVAHIQTYTVCVATTVTKVVTTPFWSCDAVIDSGCVVVGDCVAGGAGCGEPLLLGGVFAALMISAAWIDRSARAWLQALQCDFIPSPQCRTPPPANVRRVAWV